MFSFDLVRFFLQKTLENAKKAISEGNYPIGSLIVNSGGEILSSERNQCATFQDITAHAEILCIRKLGNTLQKDAEGDNYLFTSLEPCFGCCFFIARTNIKHITSVLKDPHKGGMSDLQRQDQFQHFFSHIELTNEPFDDLREQSRQLMIEFFLKKGRKDAAAFYGFNG